jgi:sulfate adenylyltransferase subunit 2
MLHWTELNVWEYIERENIPVIPFTSPTTVAKRYAASAAPP